VGNRGLARFFPWPKISREKRLLYISILVLILFLAVPWPGLFFSLRVKQGRSGPALLTLPFAFRQMFSLSYTHPIYLAPVVEKLEAEGPAIHLREISTKSWGAAEYYNFPGTLHQEKGEVHIRDIQFTVSELPVIIGFTGTQRLTWKDRVFALYELSAPGSILVIKPVKISPGGYLWERTFQLRNAG
jgi:hypothetical protein